MAYTYSVTSYAGDTGVSSTLVAIGDATNEASPTLYAARTIQVPVNFGTGGSDRCRTSVTGVPWLKGTPRPLALAVGRSADANGTLFVSDEDALVNNVRAVVTNVVDGVSFDVIALSTEVTNGIYLIQIMGV